MAAMHALSKTRTTSPAPLPIRPYRPASAACDAEPEPRRRRALLAAMRAAAGVCRGTHAGLFIASVMSLSSLHGRHSFPAHVSLLSSLSLLAESWLDVAVSKA